MENGNIQIHFQIREMRNRLLPCSELLSQLLDRLFMSELSLASLQGHAHPYNYHRLSFFSDMKLEFLSHLLFLAGCFGVSLLFWMVTSVVSR